MNKLVLIIAMMALVSSCNSLDSVIFGLEVAEEVIKEIEKEKIEN